MKFTHFLGWVLLISIEKIYSIFYKEKPAHIEQATRNEQPLLKVTTDSPTDSPASSVVTYGTPFTEEDWEMLAKNTKTHSRPN